MFLKRRLLFSRAEKVRAHVEDSDGLTDYELFCKGGTDAAGQAAKQGAASHPQPTPAELQEVERVTSTARKVCKLAYYVLPLWPKMDLTDVPWARTSEPAAKEDANSVAHQWHWCRAFWRCQVCLPFKRQQTRPPAGNCSRIGATE
eukprot:2006091-Pyramimonas_sp.AAC.1